MENEKKQDDGLNLADWYERINQSEKVMRRDFEPKWKLARKRLRSEYAVVNRATNPYHKTVNLVYSIGNAFVNSVAFKMPEVNFIARNDAEIEYVENIQAKVNDYFKDKVVKKTAKRIIWDAFLGGFGTRYLDFEYSDYETEEPLMVEGQPSLDGQGQPQYKRVITKNSPVFKRVRPDMVRFPEGFDFDNYQESPWVAFDLVLTVDEVKANKGFDEAATAEIKGVSYSSAVDKEKKRDKDAGAKDLYTRVHYIFLKPEFEGDTFKCLVLSAENKQKHLKLEEFEKGQEGYPVDFLVFNPLDDDCPYPCGDPWLWESQLRGIDDYYQRMHNHTKRSNPKWVYDKRDIPTDTLQNLKSNDDLEWVGAEPKSGKPITGIFQSLQHPPVHEDNHTFYNLNENILNRVSPKSGLSQGDRSTSTDTATEAKIIAAGDTVDIDARIDVIKDFFVKFAKDVAGLYAKNMQGRTEVKIRNAQGLEISRTVTKDQFSTNLEADINVESMQAPNKEVYRRQLMDMLLTLKQIEPMLLAQEQPEKIDIKFLLPKILESFGMRNSEKAIVKVQVRNPNKEHEDAAFKGIPFQVQDNEDHAGHLKEHMELRNDAIRLGSYEQIMPGFTQFLDDHVLETNRIFKEKQAKDMPKRVDGTRDPAATELQRV